MTDDAYIQPSERERKIFECGFRPHLPESMTAAEIYDSHAVVDSIAAELAAALRESRNLYDLSPQESVRKFEEWRWNVVEPALERFDNLTNNKEQA